MRVTSSLALRRGTTGSRPTSTSQSQSETEGKRLPTTRSLPTASATSSTSPSPTGFPSRSYLARVEAAREAAAAANLPQSAPAAEAVAEVFAPEPASPAKSPRKRNAPAAWKSLPPAELAAHLLATLTITDSAWTTEPRLPRENRESFIRRIVLGETPESATEEAAA